MDRELMWVVSALGGLTLLGVFVRMKPGFGPYNLRAVGIVLVATLATLLALCSESGLTAAMGILGAIAGYLFSITKDKIQEAEGSPGGDSAP